MSAIRGVKDRRFKFTQLLNSMLEDSELSLKAKGFIGYCLTKPGDWHFHVTHLCSHLKEGERAIYSIINECIELGYAIRYQLKDVSGDFLSWETIISDSKQEIVEQRKEVDELLKKNEKMFTDRCFAGAPTSERDQKENQKSFTDRCFADAQNVPPSNTHEEAIRKEEQQPAASAAPSGPVVVSSLHRLDISESLKIKISREHSTLDIDKAVERCLSWKIRSSDTVGIMTTLSQADTWEDKPSNEDLKPKIDANKAYAMKHDDERNVEALYSQVIINFVGSQKEPIVIQYNENGFIEQFQSALRKIGIRPLDL